MCIWASSRTKRCGCLIPSKVLAIVLLSMLTQRAAPGARKFLGVRKDEESERESPKVWVLVLQCEHLLVDVFNFLWDFWVFSVSNVLTGLPETQVLRWEHRRSDSDSLSLGGKPWTNFSFSFYSALFPVLSLLIIYLVFKVLNIGSSFFWGIFYISYYQKITAEEKLWKWFRMKRI